MTQEQERIRVLMKVEPYREAFGSYEYLLSHREQILVGTASDDDWRRARRSLEVERRTIAYEFDLLEDLLGVIARHPGVPVPVALTITSDTHDPDADAFLALALDEFKTAWRCLYQLGWVQRA